jgi:hypothetical protein
MQSKWKLLVEILTRIWLEKKSVKLCPWKNSFHTSYWFTVRTCYLRSFVGQWEYINNRCNGCVTYNFTQFYIVVNQTSDSVLINCHCEDLIWNAGFTTWQSGWSLRHLIGDGLSWQVACLEMSGSSCNKSTFLDKCDKIFWHLCPSVNKPWAFLVAKTLIVQITKFFKSIHN